MGFQIHTGIVAALCQTQIPVTEEGTALVDDILFDRQIRAELFAPKNLTAEEQNAVRAQAAEEEDDLALLEEDL